ncbi:hypothetical protein COUCH_02210 [Couchioplanes caeruleus]|uniref:P-loop ATPase, Sll1717 family n=1 Tax=Couchioplanes caeruleus TaxID=56438 RepID=UPI0020BE94BB|nr:hypothetical protein [Couchioplanes caeruleus]UQU65185.1 hypothetical protein COUCH_02210 [Couchioplanes caeruleus]
MSGHATRSEAETFLYRYGFESDPFQLTNSDSEPLLDEYFVPPPFYSGVLGDPGAPVPIAVFAPRGTGKTAQRISVERRSQVHKEFLCVTYDEFWVASKKQLDEVSLASHLANLCTRLTIAALTELGGDPNRIRALNPHQKQVLLFSSRRFLGKLTQQQYEEALTSVKTLKDKAGEFWNRYGGLVANVVTALLKKVHLDGLTIPSELNKSLEREDSIEYLFKQLLGIIQALGYRSTYVLVDRVDELVSTAQDSQASWRLVQDLLVNLPVLETKGVGFKFFLWDQLREHFLAEGGRPDRVRTYELKWSTAELTTMLRRRLSAYSTGKVGNLNYLLDPNVALDVEALVVNLAAGSPRDMVRICKAIIDEGTRISAPENGLHLSHVLDGVRSFSREYADLVCAGRLPELRKIGAVTFTINQLASDVFNVSENAARSKVQKWQDAGLVHKVDERPNRVNRPLHVYSVRDPRVAIACCEGFDLELVLDNYLYICSNCDGLIISSDNKFRCPECDHMQSIDSCKSLWSVC